MFKRFLPEAITAVVTGVIGFLIFDLSPVQSLFFIIYLFAIFFVYKNFFASKKETTVTPKTNENKYNLLEKELKAMTAKADKVEKDNKTIEMFLASMSHEIRTPLNGIIGLTEVLDDTKLTDEQKEFVSMIRDSSDNLRVIVNDILDVSKINAGKMEFESIEFNLFKKIESSVGIFVAKIEEKGLILNLFTDPRIPQYIVGDPTRLSQVVINLVSNAIKFTERNGHIDVFAEYIEEKNGHVTFKVSVTDSGIGMTEEQQAKIFDAYSQAEASTTRKAGGTGLGLTISSKIIESMGGELSVTSKVGEGTTFFFTITMDKAAKKDEELFGDFKDINVGVLISDTHPNNQWQEILKKYITFLGANYQECLEKDIFKATLPDILLIDHDTIDTKDLDRYTDLSCKRILLTSSTLHKVEKERDIFDDILHMPVSFERIGKTLLVTKEEVLEEKPSEVTEESEKKKFENLQVLVAEDNPINQKLIRVVLENFGLEVTIAANGEEALEYRKNNEYAMIFMDIQMPVMGGVESTHLILEHEKENDLKHIPIIALTANALAGDREKYMAEGMDDYATKPLDVKVIEKLISEYCNI